MKTNGFEIKSPVPTVSSISPTSGNRGWPVSIAEINGADFQPLASVKLRSGSSEITATGVTVVSPLKITCAFDLTGKTAGFWNVVVINTDTKEGVKTGGFLITSPAPTVSSITPSDGLNTKTVSITNLSGTGFQSGAKVNLTRTGYPNITATGVTIVSPTKITCTFDLTGKAAGLWDVVVTNTDGLSGTLPALPGGFTVRLPAPTVTARSNATIYRGWMGYELITGTNFVSGAQSVINTTTGNSIPSTSSNFKSSTQMFCSYNLLGAPVSTAYRVAVINPDGQSGLMTTNLVSVSSPKPTVSSITPASATHGLPVPITNLAGTGFQPEAKVNLTRTGYSNIAGTGVTVVSSSKITCTFDLTGATAGSWNVVVTNTDGQYGTKTSSFKVT